jgi:YegS/Rv2252/BmrU family lipid kinase
MQTAALIVNGKSRRGRDWFRLADAELRELGLNLVESHLVRRPEALSARVSGAIGKGIPLVCVGGGDGTLSAVAGEFVGRESILGIIPAGTGNAFARDLGIPTNIRDSAKLVVEGIPEPVDLGQVDGRCFVNLATVGLSTLIAENLDAGAKRRFGRVAYLGALFKAVSKGKRFDAKIQLPDEELAFRSIQIVIGNGRYHAGPFPVTPEAGIQTGKLAGYSVNSSRKGVLIRYALRLWLGRHVDMDEVVPFSAPDITVATTPIRRITVDGETKLQTPGRFRSLPGAIRVMVAPRETGPDGTLHSR